MFKKTIILFVLFLFAFSCENPAGGKEEDKKDQMYGIYRVKDFTFVNQVLQGMDYHTTRHAKNEPVYTLKVPHDGNNAILYEDINLWGPDLPFLANVNFDRNANPLSISFTIEPASRPAGGIYPSDVQEFRFNMNAMTVDRKEYGSIRNEWEYGLVLRKM